MVPVPGFGFSAVRMVIARRDGSSPTIFGYPAVSGSYGDVR